MSETDKAITPETKEPATGSLVDGKGLENMKAAEIKDFLDAHGISYKSNVSKSELLELAKQVSLQTDGGEAAQFEDDGKEDAPEVINPYDAKEVAKASGFPFSVLVKNNTVSAFTFAELGAQPHAYLPALSGWCEVSFQNQHIVDLFKTNLSYLAELNGWHGNVGVLLKGLDDAAN